VAFKSVKTTASIAFHAVSRNKSTSFFCADSSSVSGAWPVRHRTDSHLNDGHRVSDALNWSFRYSITSWQSSTNASRPRPFNAEQALTKDTVPVNVDAIIFWPVADAKKKWRSPSPINCDAATHDTTARACVDPASAPLLPQLAEVAIAVMMRDDPWRPR
jgi:hypothetical protein